MCNDSFRNKVGEYTAIYDDEEFLTAIRQFGGAAPTKKIADRVGASQSRTYSRLRELCEEGAVKKNWFGGSIGWDIEEDCAAQAVEFLSNNLSESPPAGFSATQGMVISIQEPHSKAILNGEKTIEFRRSKFRSSNTPDIGFIHETAPTKALVGVFSIKSIESLPVKKLKELAKEQRTSTPESIGKYFKGKDLGTAIFIDRVEKIDPPIPLHLDGAEGWRYTPPQSYYYVDPGEFMASLQNQNRDSLPGEFQQLGLPSNTS